MTRSRLGRAIVSMLAVAVAFSLASCSSKSTGKAVHPVRGKVLVGDKPAVDAFVLFIPVNEPKDPNEPRPRATVESDGSFELSTNGEKDGAPAGEYIVMVTWPGKVLLDGREEPEDKLFGKYNNPARPLLKATVREGKNDLDPFQLK